MPKDISLAEAYIYDQIELQTHHSQLAFKIYKRVFDISISMLLLPLLLIICTFIYALNPTYNPGNLFYSQSRIGKNNRRFTMLKLRTMHGDCDKAKFATEECSRITKLGQFMRDTHIDELPQILNVLKGEMSLIGPRPEQLEFFYKYACSISGFTLRQTIRPGISGLAQLRYGYTDCNIGAQRKLKWDIEYIQRQSFRLEIHIFLKTLIYLFPRIPKRFFTLIISKVYS